MNKKLVLALTFVLSLLGADELSAQKYWVKFKNKGGTPYTLSNPSAYLSAKAIARRTQQGIAIDSTDLPVTPSYVTQVDNVSGVTVLYRSKWLNGIVVKVTNTVALTSISALPFVQSTGAVNKYRLTFPAIDKNNISSNSSSQKVQNPNAYNYGNSLNQAQMIGADCMHNAGFRGQGITIAVMDAGFRDVNLDNIYDSLFIQGRLKGTRDFVTGDTMVFEDHTHGAQVLSTMAGITPGTIIGTAPKANYWLLRTEDVATETISEEYNWIRGAEFADSLGADICTTSLGYTTFDGGSNDHTYSQLNGKTAPMSIAATMATRKGMIVLNAAGNEGGGSWNFISVPSDADSIISVGAVDPAKNKAGFSSFGPTADGRIKPDLCAQGGPAWVCYGGCYNGSGTSFATPVLAGAVACLLQCKPFAKPQQIIAAMKATATNSAIPNNSIGWGVPNMCLARLSSLLSVNDISSELNSGMQVYPNPFNSNITIQFNNQDISNTMVTITDVIGKVIVSKNYQVTNSMITITELENLKQGVYFVTVTSGNLSSVKKIVKQ